ncbi:MAG: PIG-L family deacetylase [Lachnospiraceae bacterium]|nr:PIG-L family deacetylase [Lachnospiraceae bacterium]
MRKYLYIGLFAAWALLVISVLPVKAEELTPQIRKDNNTITVTTSEGTAIGAVYIKWNKTVQPYELLTDTGTFSCGENGFLHEFIPLDTPSSTLTFMLPAENPMGIYEIRVFSDLNVPEDVQIWEPPCDRADILVVSAHSDDEILFMGGIMPTYAAEQGARVQVAYMTEFWSTAPIREHEKLDGLWTDGLHTYPINGNFKDMYAADLETAQKIYDLDAMTAYVTQLLDRFQPQVTVTHDFNGEYGHGFHQLTARAVAQALEQSSHEVSKAYFHLYPQNSIHMDLNIPLDSMGGRTALDAAKEAYLQHVSQQWCWFYVSDSYEYSCADFGLYHTTVGSDTTDSMLDHIILYDEQERLELERLEQEHLEQQQLEQQQLEQERLAKEKA